MPEVWEWLKANYAHHANCTTFVSPADSGWKGAGRKCIEIPFAGEWRR